MLSNIKLHSAGLGVLSLRRAPNLGMSCVPRSLMSTSPLEPTSALEPPPIFSHPLASSVRQPRQFQPKHPRTTYVGAEADDWPTLRFNKTATQEVKF